MTLSVSQIAWTTCPLCAWFEAKGVQDPKPEEQFKLLRTLDELQRREHPLHSLVMDLPGFGKDTEWAGAQIIETEMSLQRTLALPLKGQDEPLEVTIKGRLDHLAQRADGALLVIDRKTSAVQEGPAYLVQLSLYAWMLAEAFPSQPVTGCLVHYWPETAVMDHGLHAVAFKPKPLVISPDAFPDPLEAIKKALRPRLQPKPPFPSPKCKACTAFNHRTLAVAQVQDQS